MNEPAVDSTATAARKWQPLSAVERRLAGVLVEKAKTTPEQYPLTLNGLVTGANQKNNRDPQMELDAQRAEEALDRLKAVGAVIEVQGSGRVAKYRHLLYDWLGVEKAELAVMAELLLRGAQTEGELRGRAARMEPIADLNALKPILDSLIAKELVVRLTPEGRGAVVTHALYKPNEMERLRAEFQSGAHLSPAAEGDDISPGNRAGSESLAGIQQEVASLRAEVAQLRAEVQTLTQLIS